MTIKAHGNLAPSRSLSKPEEWTFKPKSYPHFDAFLSEAEARALAADASRVAAHTFYPFLRYHQRWTKFSEKGVSGVPKERPIRFAGRADSYIFSYYRHLLCAPFEKELKARGLDHSVLAYRRVIGADGKGQCNIHFALEAVRVIRAMGDCCVIALDISSFFESLDHERLKQKWCSLLGVSRLPADHYKVYQAITSYSVIDRDELFERLGYIGPKYISRTGEPINGYLVEQSLIPRQLCTGKEFREKIAGGNGQPSLIKRHWKPYGIPQGSPISDLLANFYLLDFDTSIKAKVDELGGRYFRYSDDILIVAPVEPEAALELEEWVRAEIISHGPKLRIKREKSAIFHYEGSGEDQSWSRIVGEQGTNGLEYLGFRYDGRNMLLRDSTLSGLQRKANSSAKRMAITLLKRFPEKTTDQIMSDFNLSGFLQRYGRVRDFESKADDVRNWTFWTYATRAASLTAPLGLPIYRQLRNYRQNMRAHLKRALEKRRPV
ncbi:MAG: reverse transcriptase domain-containing protein [Shinella sp.]|uniref:reverse transcriptase domain-containing protein n=1 Tax=Shinella sp. TaxID=1870904 RepID=UPI003C75BCE9